MRATVIMEHDGSGQNAEPIAIIQNEEPGQTWRVENWLENNGWYQDKAYARQWTKMVSTTYGPVRRFAGISQPVDVTEAIY